MASSSSHYSSSPNRPYDVFPSFSGEDVRNTFLSHFLKELDRKLIHAFKDNEIERSRSLDPELKHAIKDSKIAVVVFSNNYASSSWCLNELLEIVRCKQEFGQFVIPIFYRLEPSHVRKQTGDFGKIFEKTCQHKTEDEKVRWSRALTDVANILGYHIVTRDNEASIIEVIANDILGKLNLSPSYEFEDFVGVEDHIREMSSLLHLESEEVRMVGIWGPSGIGKTTIARALFSRLSSQFQSSVFLDRIFIAKSMEVDNRANLVDYNMKLHLQRSFLAKVLDKKDIKIDHIGAIQKMLKHWKSLIFIDDLDDQDVLDALVGQTQWFGNGSRIIVVTKNKHFLRAHGIDQIYKVPFPSYRIALEMFCRYAFRKNSPPDGFMELSSEVVLRAGNLPLGLNVLGSYLRGKDKEDWMDAMPRLRNDLDGKIEKTLRVSYDELNNRKDKAIFRHIACLFSGEKVSDIKLLLEDSKLDVHAGLKNLVDKSLIHEGENTVVRRLSVHSLLQKMGKEIVRAQSNEPGEREFIVDSKDICDVLEDNTGTKRVLGISLDIDETDELHINKGTFKGMRNLIFLNFFTKKKKEVRWNLPDGFDYFPPKLRFLSWANYPLRSMPCNFRPQNLVKLDMKLSKLEKLWDGVHPLKNLKKMDLWGSKNLKEIPNLSMATNLEELVLSYCSSLVELPSSIQHLNKLEELWMRDCEKLEILPNGINLKSLNLLNLIGCSRLRSFPNISSNIATLYLHGTSLVQPFMGMLSPTLTKLDLSDIPSLVELPSSFQNLHKLKDLCITNCINLETLPTCINLESLHNLDLSGCSQLKTFPDIATNIQRLNLSKTGIEEVPWWIEKFSKLTYLNMCGCKSLQCVSLNICKLKHLVGAYISDCRALYRVSLDDSQSAMETATNNIKLLVHDEASSSSSFPDNYFPKAELRFTNCINLDQEALLEQQSVFCTNMVLSGEEVPSYFTHQTTEISLTNIPLLHTSLSQRFFKFKACAVIIDAYGYNGVNIHVKCRFKGRFGKSFDSYGQAESFWTNNGSHLLIFECRIPLHKDNALLAQLNYDHVDLEILISIDEDYEYFEDLRDRTFKFKGWGIRLFKDCSSPQNQLGNESEHGEECGGNDVVTERSSKRVRIT
ncbi:Disease resistance protein RPS6 [Cardamine amara subsp. amara]|uniref:ADP-ribosyl cyclase/cyclic ADP-ribose hydrolase n=1 Tax=Cardamine amara subsp. amara TaxID=228776 RepID=A0ABD0ZVX4_CARAN